jgi:hypothetical protein
MRNVTDKICRGNQNTHFVLSNVFLEIAVYKKKWENIEQQVGHR